jgi:hypothetical protein
VYSNTWSADQAYTSGGWGYDGGNTYTNVTSIGGTTDPTLYQSERWGMSAYRFDVPNGTYQVKLKFAEIFWSNPGQRLFDVRIEGVTALSNLDLVATVGRYYAYDSVSTVTVYDGRLDIEFSATVNYPKVSAIEVVSVGAPVTGTPAPYVRRVNAGGPSYTDVYGNAWSTDQAYTSGGWGYDGGNTYINVTSIGGTTDPTLYQSERWGMSAYRFDVPNGTYRVRLKFAEIFWWNPGQRRFDVRIEGVTALSNLDLVATVGRYYAYDSTTTVTVYDGRLDIEFSATVNYPKVSAIEVTSYP